LVIDIRDLEPYHQLSKAASKPRNTILLEPCSTPFLSLFSALTHFHFFHAFIAFVAILGEFLVIVVGAIPFNKVTTLKVAKFSRYSSMGVLSLMIIAIVCVFFRRRKPALPREPHTIASQISYLCASKMLDDCKGLSMLDRGSVGARVRGWGKLYQFGRGIGVDGKLRWSVDEA
jgi:Protein of unknown function (DUF3433)